MTDNAQEITEQLGAFKSSQNLLKQTVDKKYFHLYQDYPNGAILSGFKTVDQLTGGFKKGELTTIAVRPGIGKTAFLLSLLNNISVLNHHKCGVFSAERSSRKLFQRLIESNTGIPLNKINSNRMTDVQRNIVVPVLNTLTQSQLYIDDSINPTAEYIIEKSKEMAAGGVEIIFIDYLELLTTELKTKNRPCDKEPYCVIMTFLSKLAKEINIPIVIFSQLSKPIIYNNRFKYTPDFINEITDVLLFLNRPDFYHINDIDGKEKGLAEITAAKVNDKIEFQVANLRFVESLDKYTDCLDK
jgi:replicative DNA helicase